MFVTFSWQECQHSWISHSHLSSWRLPSCSLSYFGLIRQNLDKTRVSAWTPLNTRSAGLSEVEQYLQRDAEVSCWISMTWLAMKAFHLGHSQSKSRWLGMSALPSETSSLTLVIDLLFTIACTSQNNVLWLSSDKLLLPWECKTSKITFPMVWMEHSHTPSIYEAPGGKKCH